jgi:protein-disulfide isomerase
LSKAKRDPGAGPEVERVREKQPFPSARAARAATLAGMAALVVLSGMTWREVRQIRSGLDSRLEQIDSQIAKLGTRIPQPAAAQRGPDPNRVYSVKAEGAPVRGPAAAPVTIAEFSDFQ